MRLNQITLSVTDMAAAVDFYLELGAIQIVDTPHYARFMLPEGDSSFSLHLCTDKPGSGHSLYFESDRLDDWVAELKTRGIAFDSEPEDQRWLWREANLKDPSGNHIKLYHAGDMRLDPPWRVTRRKH